MGRGLQGAGRLPEKGTAFLEALTQLHSSSELRVNPGPHTC